MLQSILNWCAQIHQVYRDAQETGQRSDLDKKIYIRMMSFYFFVLFRRMEDADFEKLKSCFDTHSFTVVRNGLRHYFYLPDISDNDLIKMIDHLMGCLPVDISSLNKRISLRRSKQEEENLFKIFSEYYENTHVKKEVKESGMLIFSEDERRTLRTPQEQKVISFKKNHPQLIPSLSESSKMVEYLTQQIQQGNQDNNLLRALAVEYMHLFEALMPLPDKFAPPLYKEIEAVGRRVAHANKMLDFSWEDLKPAHNEYLVLKFQITEFVEKNLPKEEVLRAQNA